MFVRNIFIFLFLILLHQSMAQTTWQSNLLSVDADGKLTYNADNYGFTLPDFSHAGYRGGGIPLPQVAVVKEVTAIAGDNTQNIQAAIDFVGAMPKNSEGFRGAILLKAGKYAIAGTLYVRFDGVVLRGEGEGDNPLTSTILYATGNIPAQRDVDLLWAGVRGFGGVHRSGQLCHQY